MALTIIKQPFAEELSKSPIVLKVSTDQYIDTPGAFETIKIPFTFLASKVNNETITFKYEGEDIVFTFKAVPTPNSNNLELKAANPTNTFDRDYAIELLHQFFTSSTIYENFNISLDTTVGTPVYLVFTHKTMGDISSGINTIGNYVTTSGTAETLNDDLKIICKILIENDLDSLVYDELIEMELPVNYSDKSATFQINQILHNALFDNNNLPLLFPDFTSNVILIDPSLKNYKLFFAENTAPINFYKLNKKILLGGKTKLIKPTNYFNENIMSNQWAVKQKITEKQPLFISFYSGTLYNAILVKYTAHFNDGSTQVITAPSNFDGRKKRFIIPAGICQHDSAISNPENIVRWEILITATLSAYPLTKTFYVEKHCASVHKYIAFQNSLGGLETIMFTGEQELNIDIDKEEAERILDYDYNTAAGDSFTHSRTIVRNYKMESQIFETYEEAAALQDLFFSNYLAELDVENNKYIPINEDNRSIEIGEKTDQGFVLKWNYNIAYKENSF